jgi:hypothetical protein
MPEFIFGSFEFRKEPSRIGVLRPGAELVKPPGATGVALAGGLTFRLFLSLAVATATASACQDC